MTLATASLAGCGALTSSKGESGASSSASTSDGQSSGSANPASEPAPGPQDSSRGETLKISPTPFTEEEKQEAVKVTTMYIQARTESNWSVACELATAESNGSYFVLESQIEKDACIHAANQNVPPVDPAKAQSIRQALDGAAFTVEDHGDGTADVKSEGSSVWASPSSSLKAKVPTSNRDLRIHAMWCVPRKI